MNMPANVTAASEKSDILIKQLQETREPKVTDTSTATDTSATQAPGADPAKATQTQTQTTTNDFETKYRTLQGKYNAEIPRLDQSVRTLQYELKNARDKNTRLQESGQNTNTDPNGEGHIDSGALSEYGEEFGAVAERMNSIMDENASLKAELQTVKAAQGEIQATQGKTAYDGYIGQIAENLKAKGRDFSKMNADPDFLTWLQDIHPYTGRPRHEALSSAERAMDVERTMRIFDEYLGGPSPQVQQTGQANPNVQPPHNASGSDVSPPMPGSQGRIWTRAEVSQLYKDKSMGLYKGRDTDFKAVEADLFAAQRDGRIR